ncbi:MAG TPA: hypothetical protein VFL47_07890, partial [Flavisolibacter sp.]|nr:hypothetical protein [Flavisolibacter sp.]
DIDQPDPKKDSLLFVCLKRFLPNQYSRISINGNAVPDSMPYTVLPPGNTNIVHMETNLLLTDSLQLAFEQMTKAADTRGGPYWALQYDHPPLQFYFNDRSWVKHGVGTSVPIKKLVLRYVP